MDRVLKIAILAGEASGDFLGASLISALNIQHSSIEIKGLGGPLMIKAGCESLFDIERLSVMGFVEPIKRLPDLIKLRGDFLAFCKTWQPDIFIGIDSPDFNLGLEIKLRNMGIKVVHVVSPSVWAWRKWRIHKIAKAVDLMLTLFPFEKIFYDKHHIPARYVGHPLAEKIPLEINTEFARTKLGLDLHKTYITILPGSRSQEIDYLAPVFLQAAKLLKAKYPNVEFLTSHLRDDEEKLFLAIKKEIAEDLPLHSFLNRAHDVMAAADVVMVTSGTATMEVMLHKKPMVIAYKMPTLTYLIGKCLVKRPVGLPNILAGELLVRELLQHEATPEALSREVSQYLNYPAKILALKNRFYKMHQLLHKNSAEEMVKAVFQLI